MINSEKSLKGYRVSGDISFTIIFSIAAMLVSTTIISNAQHFGFKGGFRGSYGGHKSFARSHSGFSSRSRISSHGYRGLSSYNRSRYNSLAFRSRRYGHSNNFNRVSSFHGSSRHGFGSSSRFSSTTHLPRSVSISHFPSHRIHSTNGKFGKTFAHQSHPVVVKKHPVTTHHVAHGNGWTYLANGQLREAQNSFVHLIGTGTKPASSRVGYALAVASRDNLSEGSRAMRRAMASDKNGVMSMKFENALLPTVGSVTQKYEKHYEANHGNKDTAFMLAVLYQMQGDPEMASLAVSHAEYYGDTGTEITYLKDVIKDQMKLVPMTHSDGWVLLEKNEPSKAAKSFISDIETNLSAGAPKLGYAFALAGMGDLDRGVWAMRRAFSLDPEGASDVLLSGEIRPYITNVTKQYENQVETVGITDDNAYMLSVLYLLQGDIEAANGMLKKSNEKEDSFVSKMISEEMKTQLALIENLSNSDA